MRDDEKPTRVKPIVPLADPSQSLLPPNAPNVLGERYEILGLIGMGGMGAVYRARDVVLSEIVALKILRPVFAADSESLVQFCQEVRLARRVTHKNVARTYDLGEADGQRFLTMELVEGQTLGALLDASHKLGIARTIEIALDICEGVAAAHDAGVVHRDLKPDNVAIAPDGRVVVMDFGIARHVGESSERAGFIVGTPEYMAPEQAQGAPDVDGRADQYAIGTMMFEMLTGQLPFAGPALVPILRRTTEAPPDPRTLCPEVPEALAKLVVRCLARAREDRFADLHAVASELRRARGVSESVPPSRSAPRKGGRALPTIAVFPLDVTGHPESEHLGWAFAGGLIDALSSLPGLTIHPRGVTSSLSITSSDPRTLGRRMGAEVIVHGSLRPDGDRFVAHVRLTMVEDGFQIWHRRIEGARNDVERVADETGRNIAESLGLSLPKAERVLRDPEVLDLFLRGRREYFRFTADAAARAQELLRLATERAPTDAVVLAAYAAALGRQVGIAPQTGRLSLAREIAERARAAAPHAPEPMIAFASVLLQGGDAAGAAQHAARALAIAPRSAEAHELAANLFFEAGALMEGHAHLDIAVHLEPRLVGVRYQAARAEALAGNWTEIERLVLGPVDPLSPFVYWADRFRLSFWRGDAKWIDGVDLTNERGLTEDEKTLAVHVATLLRERKTSLEARATIDAMRTAPSATDRAKTLASQLQAEGSGYVGDRERCVTCILAAVSTGLFDSPWLELCPALACARDAPELVEARATVRSRANAVLAALRAR